MIRTAPIAAASLRTKAVVAGCFFSVLIPVLIGWLLSILPGMSASEFATFLAEILVKSPIISAPFALIGAVLAAIALRTGYAGPLVAAAAGSVLGIAFSMLFIFMSSNMLVDGRQVYIEAPALFGLSGALWALLFWCGVRAFLPDALRPRTSN